MESVEPSTAEVDRMFEALSRKINKASEDTTHMRVEVESVGFLCSLYTLRDALNLKALTKDQQPWVVIDVARYGLPTDPEVLVCYCKAVDLVYLTRGW